MIRHAGYQNYAFIVLSLFKSRTTRLFIQTNNIKYPQYGPIVKQPIADHLVKRKAFEYFGAITCTSRISPRMVLSVVPFFSYTAGQFDGLSVICQLITIANNAGASVGTGHKALTNS